MAHRSKLLGHGLYLTKILQGASDYPSAMTSNVSGKVAFVTGGASGIGAALTTKLVNGGAEVWIAEVWIADRQIGAAQELAQRLNRGGAQAHAIELDVRSYPSFERAVAEAVQHSGRIDYLFNNAGIGVSGEVDSYTLDDWNDVFDVNLRGVVHGIQAAYPIMIRQHSGHIVNTASMAGLITSPGLGSYTAAKHAVVAISKTLRVEAERHGVQVSVFCPGVIRTPMMTGGKYGRMNVAGVRDEELLKSWERLRPMAPENSPSAPFGPWRVETRSSWSRRGGRHCGTWNAFPRPYRCGLEGSRSSAYVKWIPPHRDPLRVFMVRRTGSSGAHAAIRWVIPPLGHAGIRCDVASFGEFDRNCSVVAPNTRSTLQTARSTAMTRTETSSTRDGSMGDETYPPMRRPLVLAGIRDFLPGAASEWDHLLMDQDDPEKRIADLEHQLAERMRGADLPPALPRTWVSVDGGGFQHAGTPEDEATFGGQRPRRTVGWTDRVDVATIVVIGIVAAVLFTMLIPSSALWTSGIVCNTPSHLEYSQSLSLGHATSRTFQCVSGDSSYAASKLAIYALQTLASALVLCGVSAGRLTWRAWSRPISFLGAHTVRQPHRAGGFLSDEDCC